VAEGPLLSTPRVDRSGIFLWLLHNVVAVRYSFFLVVLLMASRRPPLLLPGWLLVVTIAILLHELGHAVTARAYGQNPAIELHAMGGTTSWQWRGRPRWHQRALIALAGPAVGFAAGGLLYAATTMLSAAWPFPALVLIAVRDFLWVTLAWGAFNLLPILPLDGGGVAEAVLSSRLDEARARFLARVLSCVCGALCAVLAIAGGQVWAGVLCALFTWNNLQKLRGVPGGVGPE
jgi:stage IV sporulation protein FB